MTIIEHLLNSPIPLSRELYEKRMAICRSCALYKDGKCSECSCDVAFSNIWASHGCKGKVKKFPPLKAVIEYREEPSQG